MAVSYKKLWKLLIDKDIKKKDLIKDLFNNELGDEALSLLRTLILLKDRENT